MILSHSLTPIQTFNDMCAVKLGQLRTGPDNCCYTVTKNDETILYAEFNSDIVSHLGTRRYRLYQVAAVANTKRLYPTLGAKELKEWVTMHRAEASHLCRKVTVTSQYLPDGTTYQLDLVEEVKGCFNIDHLIMESAVVNRSRIRCRGGDNCQHKPKCILVNGGFECGDV